MHNLIKINKFEKFSLKYKELENVLFNKLKGFLKSDISIQSF